MDGPRAHRSVPADHGQAQAGQGTYRPSDGEAGPDTTGRKPAGQDKCAG
nr:hypothetical protein [Kibdelosporangium sp. MJ126-NF4]